MTKFVTYALVALLVFNTPTKAEPAKPQCQTAIIGADDIVVGTILAFVASYYGIKFLAWFGDGMKEEGRKEERAKQQNEPQSCKL